MSAITQQPAAQNGQELYDTPNTGEAPTPPDRETDLTPDDPARQLPPEAKDKSVWYVLSQVMSFVLHPFIVPIYAVLLLIYGNPIMVLITPPNVQFFLIAAVILNTFIIPALFIGLLRALGILKSITLDTRSDRVIPILITAICYMACAFMVRNIFAAFLVQKFLLAGAACLVVALIVTNFWKISIHMLAAGGLLSILLIVAISGLSNLMPYIIVLILLCGALASARLYLGSHTPMQVLAGFFGGMATAASVVLLI